MTLTLTLIRLQFSSPKETCRTHLPNLLIPKFTTSTNPRSYPMFSKRTKMIACPVGWSVSSTSLLPSNTSSTDLQNRRFGIRWTWGVYLLLWEKSLKRARTHDCQAKGSRWYAVEAPRCCTTVIDVREHGPVSTSQLGKGENSRRES